MPIIRGAGAIATTLGMISLVNHSEFEFISFLAIAGAMLETVRVTYLCLARIRSLRGSAPWALTRPPASSDSSFPPWALGSFSMG
jgi:hypothetical protein